MTRTPGEPSHTPGILPLLLLCVCLLGPSRLMVGNEHGQTGLGRRAVLRSGGIRAPVRGNGTRSSPFEVQFTDRSGKTHSVRWRPE